MKMVKVAHWPREEITHALYSSAMVQAINEGTRVRGHDPGFWAACGQAIFGNASPVSIDVAAPARLRARRDEIFHSKLLPMLKKIPKQSTALTAANLRDIEHDKIVQLIEIQDKFTEVRRANANLDRNLQIGQRVCVGLERTAMIAEALIPASALLLGASVAVMGTTGMGLMLAGTAASFVHFLARPVSEATQYEFAVWMAKTTYRGLAVHGNAEKLLEKSAEEEAAKKAMDKEIAAAFLDAGEDAAKNPAVAKLMTEAAEKKAAAVAAKSLAWRAMVISVAWEVVDEVMEGRKDWYAGGPGRLQEDEVGVAPRK